MTAEEVAKDLVDAALSGDDTASLPSSLFSLALLAVLAVRPLGDRL